MNQYPQQLVALASFRKFIGHIQSAWPGFLNQRSRRLVQAERNGSASEKVAEDILSDFFTLAIQTGFFDHLQTKLEDLRDALARMLSGLSGELLVPAKFA